VTGSSQVARTTAPRVAVVLVSWNSLGLLPACLASLRAQTLGPVDIVMVDNGSIDGSVEALRAEPGVTLVENRDNRGFAAANNQGIRQSTTEFVMLLNTDVVLADDYLERCLESFADPLVGSVTGKLLRPGHPGVLDSAGHNVFGLGWAENRGEELPDVGYDEPHEVFGVCAAAAVYRRSALDDVADRGEVLDESYFAYIEDIDLDWRLRWMGWRAMYRPDAVAVHHRSASGARHTTPIMRHILKNRLLTVAKNYDSWSLVRHLPAVLVFSAVKAVDFAREDPRAALGLTDFIASLPDVARKRRWLRDRRRARRADMAAWLRPFPWRSKLLHRALRRPGRRVP